jgi:hypothetical protein
MSSARRRDIRCKQDFTCEPRGKALTFGIEFLVAPKKLVGYYSPWFKPKSKTEENTVV